MSRWTLFLLAAGTVLVAGCPSAECPLTVACVTSCGQPVTAVACGACPGGTVDVATCPAPTDAGSDAPASLDAGPSDTGTNEDAPIEGDAAIADAPAAPAEVLVQTCGPLDGPALRLGIYEGPAVACEADAAVGSIDILIDTLGKSGFPPFPGTTYTSTTAASIGLATVCPAGAGPCATTSTFTVTFDTVTDGVGATGTYSVTVSGMPPRTGNFAASLCGEPPICG